MRRTLITAVILTAFALPAAAAAGDPCDANTEFVCDINTNLLTDTPVEDIPCATNSAVVCGEDNATTGSTVPVETVEDEIGDVLVVTLEIASEPEPAKAAAAPVFLTVDHALTGGGPQEL